MTLTIDTDNKTILFSDCNMSEAVHFARLHEFEGYTVKWNDPSYLESEVIENPIKKLFILPNPDSDVPKIDLDKGSKYTLEFKVNGQSSIPELNKYDAEAEFKLLSTEPITK